MDIKLAHPSKTTPEDLKQLANLSAVMLQKIRDEMLEPFPRKEAPLIPSGRLQELCGIDKTRMNRSLKKGDLPQGQQSRPGAVRYFSLSEAMQWIRAELKPVPRRGPGKVIAVANFKGGVTKTTMSTLLCQGLSLRRGRKVCHVDLDPQGSATTLYGINPHAEVSSENTIMPLIEAYLAGESFDMRGLPQETYWPNLDLIPSSTELFNAEFMLPARATAEEGHIPFERVLSNGLVSLKDEYDYIILDTAPTLSYLTINAIFAADGVIVPVVPDTLAFASMVQFWQLFSDLVTGMEEQSEGSKKEFDFLDVLMTRMEKKNAPRLVADWIRGVYGSRVLPIEIPETDLARNSSIQFRTVYDLSSSEANTETMRRIRQPCDEFVDYVDDKVSALWQGIEE